MHLASLRSRLLLPCTLALAACASNPYIERTRPGPELKPGNLDYAIAYADASYDAYESKLGEEFRRQQALSTGLLGIGAAVLGAGIGSAHRDVLVGLSLTGGVAYQLGSWNSNQGRLGIYLEGMKALSCAKMAVAPLRLSKDSVKAMEKAREHSIQAIDGVASAAGLTAQALASSSNADLSQAARAELAELKPQLDQANALLGLAAGMAQRVDGAGAMLETKVDQIRALIDGALNNTLAQLSALPQLIGSISSYANVFAPGLKLDAMFASRISAINAAPAPGTALAQSAQGTTGALAPPADLGAALGQLRAARIRLASSTAQLAGATDRPVAQAVQDLKGCGVDDAKLGHALALDRSMLSFVAGEAGTAVVSISGGTKPYSVSLLDAPAKGLTVMAPAGGAVVTVVADASTVAGKSYLIRVEDSTHASVLLTVQIQAAAGGDAGAQSASASCAGIEKLSRPEACLLQSVLGVTVDGAAGTNTCAAMKKNFPSAGGWSAVQPAVAKQKGLSAWPTDANTIYQHLSQGEVDACKKSSSGAQPVNATQSQGLGPVPADPAAARNEVEKRMSHDDIAHVGAALGLTAPARTFTPGLRDALMAYQRQAQRPASGSFDKDSLAELLKKAAGAK